MRHCRQCGFPRKFARYFDWRTDGTIISTDRSKTTMQITFLEAGELEDISAHLSRTIGLPVDQFMLEAQKNVGKAIYASLPVIHMKRVPNNRFMRPQWLAKTLVKLMAADIAGLGDGRISLDCYRAGSTLVIRFKNPCVVPLLVGSAQGIYESTEDMPSSNVEYGIEQGGDLVVRLTHATERPESEARLYLESVEPGSGPLALDRCGVCAVPWPASRTFEWVMGDGIIRNRLTGRREVIVSVQSVNAILRELEGELGEDVVEVLYDAQLTRALKGLAGDVPADRDGYWKQQLEELALHGLGYPLELERTDDSVTVEIGNAYNQVLYAAKLAAVLEKSTGKPSSITWTRRERDHGAYTISVA